LFASVSVSTQAPLQAMVPAWQLAAQLPAAHTSVAPQVVVQLPQ
jgi:hypothetical protein